MKWLLILLLFASASAWADETVVPSPPPGDQVEAVDGVSRCGDPEDAVKMGGQSKTRLLVVVTKDGSVENPEVEVSSGNDRLDQLAKACALRWRYRPALQGNQPIEVRYWVNVVWRLWK